VYITTIFSNTACIVYANGAFVTNTPIDTVKASTTYALRFATDFNGIMDEYRIHDRLQDDAFVAADYATQTDPVFLTFGEVKNRGGFYILVR
jgi:outer membrane protease